MISIALDVMGGDHAPSEVIKGALLALKEYPIKLYLVGQETSIKENLSKLNATNIDNIEIVHASEVISMSESPSSSFRKKKDSSIQVGLQLVKDNKADAFVSAGNTGAILTASTLILGRLPHVQRPALTSLFPSQYGPFLLLDIGSNVDSKPSHLAQFSVMGSFFSQEVLGIDKPRVGLLNIGEEEDKGDSLTLAAHELIKKLPINFTGNIESKDILFSSADVVVCDGFVGNSILKFGEGLEELFTDFFKKEAKHSFRSLLGLLILKPAFKRFKKLFDYNEHGGAPLLGLNGVSIVAHGKSKAPAIKSAIRIAIQTVEHDVVGKIEETLEKTYSSIEDK